MLNEFQKTVSNEDAWKGCNSARHQSIVKQLSSLVKITANAYDTNEEKLEELPASNYAQNLFENFCKKRKHVQIRKFHLLPSELRDALFGNDNNKISIVSVVKLFPFVNNVILNELDIQYMMNNGERCINMVLDFIQTSINDKTYGVLLRKIAFKSTYIERNRNNTILRKLQHKYSETFTKYQWSFEYEYQMENMHKLIFINGQIETAEKIKSLNEELKECQKQRKLMGIQMVLEKEKQVRNQKDLENKLKEIQEQKKLQFQERQQMETKLNKIKAELEKQNQVEQEVENETEKLMQLQKEQEIKMKNIQLEKKTSDKEKELQIEETLQIKKKLKELQKQLTEIQQQKKEREIKIEEQKQLQKECDENLKCIQLKEQQTGKKTKLIQMNLKRLEQGNEYNQNNKDKELLKHEIKYIQQEQELKEMISKLQKSQSEMEEKNLELKNKMKIETDAKEKQIKEMEEILTQQIDELQIKENYQIKDLESKLENEINLNKELNECLLKLRTNRTEMKEKHLELERKVSNQQIEKENNEKNIKEQINELETKQKEHQMTKEMLTTELIEKDEQIKNEKILKENVEMKNTELEKELQNQQQLFVNLNCAFETEKNISKDLNSKFNSEQNLNKELNETILKLQKSQTQIEEKHLELQKKINDEQIARENKDRKMEETGEQMRAKINELEAKQKEQQMTTQSLTNELKEKEQQIQNEQILKEIVGKEKTELQKQLENKQQLMVHLKSTSQDLHSKLENEKTLNKELQKNQTEMEKEYLKLQKKINNEREFNEKKMKEMENEMRKQTNEKNRANEEEEKAMEVFSDEEINIGKMTKEQLQKKYKTLKSKNLKLQKHLTTLYSPSDDKSDFPVIESIKADFDTLRKQNVSDIFDEIQSEISNQYENKLNEENEDLYDAIIDREARRILFDLLHITYHFMRVFKHKTFNDIIENVCIKFELKSTSAQDRMSKSLSMIINPYFQTHYHVFIRNKYMRDNGKNNKNNELFSSDMNAIIDKIFVCVKEKYNYYTFWDIDGIRKQFEIFIAKACELCWLMVLNDPQLYFYPHLFSINDNNIAKTDYDKNVNFIYSQSLIFDSEENKINETNYTHKKAKKKKSKKKGNELDEEEKDMEKEIDFIVQRHDYCNPFESKIFDDKYHELLNEEDNESDNENENENKNIIKYNGMEIAYMGWPSLMRVPKMLNEQHTQITKTLVYCDDQSKQFMAKMLPLID